MPARMLAIARNHDKGRWPVSSESIHLKLDAIYSRIAPSFTLNRIFFSANEEATLKTKQLIKFQGLFKVTHKIAGK